MLPLRFAPYRAIAGEVASRLLAAREGADPVAPWREEVIVPSRGAADAIAAELLRTLPEGFAAVQLRTIDDVARHIVNGAGKTPRVASDAERRLAMRTAIRAVEHPMMESRGVASMLERAYRDVRDSGITLAEFARRASSARGLRNARRTETIVRAWSEYERLIARLDAIDPADLLADAARLADASLRPQLLAGFYDMTGAQLRLVEALLRAGRIAAIWVPSEAPFAQNFVHAIAPWSEVVRDPLLEIRAPRMSMMRYETRPDELRDVCGHVAALLADGVAPAEIGIVARSLEPYDLRLLNRFAREAGFRTTAADETPLVAHRIGRAAVTLLRLRDRGFPRAEVLELVRDGLRVQSRIDADAADAATRRARIAGGTSEELRTIGSRSAGVDDYIALVAELEDLTAAPDAAFLARLGGMFRAETETDLAAVEALDDIAALFRRAAAWNRGLDLSAVIDAIEQQSLPPATRAPGPLVWTGDVMRLRGRSFSHLFVIRMEDDVFPQRRIEDPLLPDSDRHILGLREIGDGREEEDLLFSLLGDAGCAEVRYSCASGDGFGKVLRISRFMRGLPVAEDAAERAAPPVSRRSHRRQLQLLAAAGTRGVFDGYVGALQASLESLSPTQLEDFGECPQKFFLKHILGVRDIDDPERELQINHRDKGTIDHAILERFYRELPDDAIARAAAALPRLPDDLAERLDAIVEEQFENLEREAPPFNPTIRNIERRATKRILREFLTHDLADLDAQQLVPRFFEYRFGRKHRDAADHPEPFVVETGGLAVRVEGTVDRIDAGEERFRIVDYKSGKAGRHKNLGEKIDRGVRLQLALYAMAVAEFFEADPAKVSATIKPLVLGDDSPDKFAFELHEKREPLLETLAIFIRAIGDGSFPAFPNDNDAEFNSCKYCPVSHSCRTKHDLDERYAVQQLRDPRTLLGGASE